MIFGTDSNNDMVIRITCDASGAISAIDATGQALKQAGDSASDAQAGFSSFEAGLVTFAATVDLVEKGIGYLKEGMSEIADLAEKGLELNNVSAGFNSLHDSSEQNVTSLAELQHATEGTVSNLKLMEVANQAVIRGLDQGTGYYAKAVDVAVQYGKATGQSAAESMDKLSQAVQRGSARQLEALGITQSAKQIYAAYANSIGIAAEALSQQQKEEALVEAIAGKTTSTIDQQTQAMDSITAGIDGYITVAYGANSGTKNLIKSADGLVSMMLGVDTQTAAASSKLAALPRDADSAGHAIEVLDTTWENLKGEIGMALDKNDDFAKSIHSLDDYLKGVDFKQFIGYVGDVATAIVNTSVTIFKEVTKDIGYIERLNDQLTAAKFGYIGGGQSVAEGIYNTIDNVAPSAGNLSQVTYQLKLLKAAMDAADPSQSELDAYEQLSQDVAAYGNRVKSLSDGLQGYTVSTKEQIKASVDLDNVLNKVIAATDSSTKSTQQSADAQAESAGQVIQLYKQLNDLTGGIDDTGIALSNYVKGTDDSISASTEFINSNYELADSADAATQAIAREGKAQAALASGDTSGLSGLSQMAVTNAPGQYNVNSASYDNGEAVSGAQHGGVLGTDVGAPVAQGGTVGGATSTPGSAVDAGSIYNGVGGNDVLLSDRSLILRRSADAWKQNTDAVKAHNRELANTLRLTQQIQKATVAPGTTAARATLGAGQARRTARAMGQ